MDIHHVLNPRKLPTASQIFVFKMLTSSKIQHEQFQSLLALLPNTSPTATSHSSSNLVSSFNTSTSHRVIPHHSGSSILCHRSYHSIPQFLSSYKMIKLIAVSSPISQVATASHIKWYYLHG